MIVPMANMSWVAVLKEVSTLNYSKHLLVVFESRTKILRGVEAKRRRDGEMERRRGGEAERQRGGEAERRRGGETERRRDGQTFYISFRCLC